MQTKWAKQQNCLDASQIHEIHQSFTKTILFPATYFDGIKNLSPTFRRIQKQKSGRSDCVLAAK